MLSSDLNIEVTLNDPGLVENDSSGMSCLHACICMAQRGHNMADMYSFNKINQILKTDPKLYSWEYAILADLASNGYEINSYQQFDLNGFIKEPYDYLLSYFGEEVGKDQISNSDIDQVVKDARKFSSNHNVNLIKKSPVISDVVENINRGNYVLASINQRVLQNETGIVSHLIFIYGYSKRGIRFHNPGYPSTRASEIPWALFEKAWDKGLINRREMYCIGVKNDC